MQQKNSLNRTQHWRPGNKTYRWDFCWKGAAPFPPCLQPESTQKWNNSATKFLAVLKEDTRMLSSCPFPSTHRSHWLGEKTGLPHSLKSGLTSRLLRRTGGYWKSSALSSLTPPPVAAAGSAHALLSHAVVTWEHALSQGLQARGWLRAACRPLFSAFVQKEVRDVAGKRVINYFFFFSFPRRGFF